MVGTTRQRKQKLQAKGLTSEEINFFFFLTTRPSSSLQNQNTTLDNLEKLVQENGVQKIKYDIQELGDLFKDKILKGTGYEVAEDLPLSTLSKLYYVFLHRKDYEKNLHTTFENIALLIIHGLDPIQLARSSKTSEGLKTLHDAITRYTTTTGRPLQRGGAAQQRDHQAVSRQGVGMTATMHTLSTSPDFSVSFPKCVLLFLVFTCTKFKDFFKRIFLESVETRVTHHGKLELSSFELEMDDHDQVVLENIVLACPKSEVGTWRNLLKVFQSTDVEDSMFKECFRDTMARFLYSYDDWPPVSYVFHLVPKMTFTYIIDPKNTKGIAERIRRDLSHKCSSEYRHTSVTLQIDERNNSLVSVTLTFLRYSDSLCTFLLHTTVKALDIMIAESIGEAVIHFAPSSGGGGKGGGLSSSSSPTMKYEFTIVLESPLTILQYYILSEKTPQFHRHLRHEIRRQIPTLNPATLHLQFDGRDKSQPPKLIIHYPLDIEKELRTLDYTEMVQSFFQLDSNNIRESNFDHADFSKEEKNSYFVGKTREPELKRLLAEELKKIWTSSFQVVEVKKSGLHMHYIDGVKIKIDFSHGYHPQQKKLENLTPPQLQDTIRTAVKNISASLRSKSSLPPTALPPRQPSKALAAALTDQQLQDLLRKDESTKSTKSTKKKGKGTTSTAVAVVQPPSSGGGSIPKKIDQEAPPVVSTSATPKQSKRLERLFGPHGTPFPKKQAGGAIDMYDLTSVPNMVILRKEDIAPQQQRDKQRKEAVEEVRAILGNGCQVVSTFERFKKLLAYWKIIVVGSQELGLALPESDIDIQIVLFEDGSTQQRIKNIVKEQENNLLLALGNHLRLRFDQDNFVVRRVPEESSAPSLLLFRYKGFQFEISITSDKTVTSTLYHKIRRRIDHIHATTMAVVKATQEDRKEKKKKEFDKATQPATFKQRVDHLASTVPFDPKMRFDKPILTVEQLVVALKRFYFSRPDLITIMKDNGLSSIALTIMVIAYLDSIKYEKKRLGLLDAMTGFMSFYRDFDPMNQKINHEFKKVPKSSQEKQSQVPGKQFLDPLAYPLVIQDPAQRKHGQHKIINFTERVRQWAQLLPLFNFIFKGERVDKQEDTALLDMSPAQVRSHIFSIHLKDRETFIEKVVGRYGYYTDYTDYTDYIGNIDYIDYPEKREKIDKYIGFLTHVFQTIAGIFPEGLTKKVAQKIYQVYSSFRHHVPLVVVVKDIPRSLTDKTLYARIKESGLDTKVDKMAVARSVDADYNRGRFYLKFINPEEALHFLGTSPLFPNKELLLPSTPQESEYTKIFKGKNIGMFSRWTSSQDSSPWFGNALG